MSEGLRDFLMQVLQKTGAELGAVILILLAIGLPVALAAYVFIRRIAPRHGVNVSFEWRNDDVADQPLSNTVRPSARAARPKEPDPRMLLARVYQVLVLLAGFALLAGAVAAWWAATPGNMLLLVAGILFLLSLIVILSADKYTRQIRQAEEWRGVWDELASKIDIQTVHAGPQVHVVDKNAVATAKRMKADGASLDDICRATERGYAAWDEPQRAAFRRVMQAMLEHA